MKRHGHAADDSARFIVMAFPRHGREGAPASGAFQQNGIFMVREDPCRAIAVPPCHQVRAAAFFVAARNFEHGRNMAGSHRQQVTAVRCDRVAVARKTPAIEIGIEHAIHYRSRPDRYGKTRSCSRGRKRLLKRWISSTARVASASSMPLAMTTLFEP